MYAGGPDLSSQPATSLIGPQQPIYATPDPQPHSGESVGWARWIDEDELLRTSRILVVDDEPTMLDVVRCFLQDMGHQTVFTTSDPTKTMSLIKDLRPDAVLLDIVMPKVNGLEVLRSIRANEEFKCLPVVIMTASADPETRILSLLEGATDFVRKPLDLTETVARVRNALVVKKHQDRLQEYTQLLQQQAQELEHQVRVRTTELLASRQEAIECLARAAEYRDDDTGQHVIRVGLYTGIIANALGYPPDEIETLERAAQLHDVGKIGVSDLILLKPGKLDPQEFETMKNHCQFGSAILKSRFDAAGDEDASVTNPVIELAAMIAETHHERWDGTGYPSGLKGEDIPIEGRMTTVADVYDALSSKRPYKEAFEHEKCIRILEEGRATHFDPRVLDAFLSRERDVLQVRSLHNQA